MSGETQGAPSYLVFSFNLGTSVFHLCLKARVEDHMVSVWSLTETYVLGDAHKCLKQKQKLSTDL